MPISVTPGRVPGELRRARADLMQTWRAEQLATTRAAAEKWQGGLAALLGLVTTVLIIKGRDSAEELSLAFRVAVGACMLAALLSAICASLLALRAAHGLPRARFLADDLSFLAWERVEAKRASRALLLAIGGAVLTLLLLAAAVGLTWFAPTAAAPVVRIMQIDGTTGCGELVSADAKAIVVKGKDSQLRIDPARLATMTIERSC